MVLPASKLSLLPTLSELVPWTDRRGRFNTVRATVLTALVLPGLWLAVRWVLGQLGAEPRTAAIHGTGWWAVWFLVASLVITPLKTLGGSTNIVVVRRMVGNAALLYALAHLLLYSADQQWKLAVIASEIVKRFYLLIGFVALLGLLLLGFTSTDGWIRHLGKAWKRLHRAAYAIMALGLFHFVLQSKLDVSQALLAVGVFAWLMLWRALPAGRDRSWPWLLLVSLGAALLALALEYAWYRFGTRINPQKVLLEELEPFYALHPAGQTLLLGLAATLLVAIRQLTDAMPRAAALLPMVAYALGGAAGEAATWFFGLEPGLAAADAPWPWLHAAVWVLLLAMLGRVRSRLADAWQQHAVDVLWIAAVLYDVTRITTDDLRVVTYGAAALVVASILLAARLWSTCRAVALLVLPLAAALAYQAATGA